MSANDGHIVVDDNGFYVAELLDGLFNFFVFLIPWFQLLSWDYRLPALAEPMGSIFHSISDVFTRLLLSEDSRHRPAIAGKVMPPAIIPYAVP
jgi:hypothetical protein